MPSKAEKQLEKQILKINFRLNVNERVGLRLRRAVDLNNGRSVEPREVVGQLSGDVAAVMLAVHRDALGAIANCTLAHAGNCDDTF